MKTLDEVIEAYEYCINNNYRDCRGCPYGCEDGESGCANAEEKTDALHYLTEYKQTRQDLLDGMKRLEGKELMYIHALANLEDTPPLTWEQLKQMEGKPVWIEMGACKIWGLNDGVYVDAFGKEMVTIKVLHDLWHLRKEKMGNADGWKAFRKERDENAG